MAANAVFLRNQLVLLVTLSVISWGTFWRVWFASFQECMEAAKITLALTDEQICLLIANGQFEEVSKDDKKIP